MVELLNSLPLKPAKPTSAKVTYAGGRKTFVSLINTLFRNCKFQ
jgi:hypothetical protein